MLFFNVFCTETYQIVLNHMKRTGPYKDTFEYISKVVIRGMVQYGCSTLRYDSVRYGYVKKCMRLQYIRYFKLLLRRICCAHQKKSKTFNKFIKNSQ